MENSDMPMQSGDEISWIWRVKETQKQSLVQKYWNKLFIVVCLLALSIDPLFLYVPILKDDSKCLMLDPKLKIAVLLLRSLTDLFYLMDIIIRLLRSLNYLGVILELSRRRHNSNFVLRSCVRRIAKTIWTSNEILVDIVALLPLPQVAILIFFSKMSDLRSLTTKRMVLMNVFVMLQYMPRVLRISLSIKELERTPEEKIISTWIIGVFQCSAYIIASHVFGAMWYFFAIQRMMICWHSACRKDDGCDNRIFGCRDDHEFRNTTILNNLCSVNSSDTMRFDFGIFATALQHGVVGSTNFYQKFLNCLWWGLRNLSSFGSNLEPSVDGWENFYAIFVSISGVFLFLIYLSVNLQMFMQYKIKMREKGERWMLNKQKVEEKGQDVELWLFKRGVPTRLNKHMKLLVMEKVQALEDGMEISLDDILHLLPSDVQSRIEDYMPLAKLKQVPMLRGMDEGLLKRIYEQLVPVKYTDNSFIIQKGEQLEKMVYIVDGFVSIEERSSDDLRRGAGELCGEELLRWPFYSYFPHRTPLATESVKAIGVVEALALRAWELESIYRQSYIFENEKLRHRRMMKEEIEQNIDGLIRRSEIPERLNQDVKLGIMKNVEEKFQQGDLYWDLLDWDHLVYCLHRDFQDEIESHVINRVEHSTVDDNISSAPRTSD